MNVPDITSLIELDQILQNSVRTLRTSSLGVAFGCLHLSLAHPVCNILSESGKKKKHFSPYPIEGTSSIKLMPISIDLTTQIRKVHLQRTLEEIDRM